MYERLFFLCPTLFHYSDAIFVPGPTLESMGIWTGMSFSLDFTMYSACAALVMGYPRIYSASAIVSLMNVLQVLGTMLISALLVATFVQNSSQDHF